MNRSERLFESLKLILKKGFIHVLSASVFNKIVGLISSVLIVRIISKKEYGLYGWAYNIISVFLIFTGLGINTGILQFCSEKIETKKKQEYYKFGLFYGLSINCIIAILALVYAMFFDLSVPEGKIILIQLVALPIFDFLYSFCLIFLRTKLENKIYSRVTNINSLGHLILMISGAYLFGVSGYIIGYYLSYILCLIYVFIVLNKDIKSVIRAHSTSLRENLSLVKYSLVCACNNGLAHLLYVLDVFFIGIIISNPELIASYKASTTIPTAMSFISTSIIMIVYPYFARHMHDIKWLKKNTRILIMGLFIINLPIGLILYIGAPLIVKTLYGNTYLDAVPIFRILSIGYIITTSIRIPCGNIMASLRKVKVNLVFDIFTGVSNIILDVILISKFGSLGAAYATLIVICISSCCLGSYLILNLLNEKRVKN